MMFTRLTGNQAKNQERSTPRLFRYITRHVLLLIVFALAATGAIGGSLIGLHTFAQGPCTGGARTYYIRWGDTLGAIASRYGTSVQRLASYNHVYNVNLIYAGQRLCIPGGSATPVSTGGTTVVFRNGYVGTAQQDAMNAGISAYYFVRQINQESGFNPYAVSYAGAIGIAQFMPATAYSLGINPYNPYQSLWGAANLMGSYTRQYGSYEKALAAYNAGPGAVNRAVYGCGGSWMWCLPYETQNYIRVIMN
jgi:hypothetical protein